MQWSLASSLCSHSSPWLTPLQKLWLPCSSALLGCMRHAPLLDSFHWLFLLLRMPCTHTLLSVRSSLAKLFRTGCPAPFQVLPVLLPSFVFSSKRWPLTLSDISPKRCPLCDILYYCTPLLLIVYLLSPAQTFVKAEHSPLYPQN